MTVCDTGMDVRSCSGEDWDAFLASSPHGAPFGSGWFVNALGLRKEHWLVVDRGRPIMATPLLFEGDAPLESVAPFSMYIGPVLAEGLAEEAPHRRLPLVIRAFETLLGALTERYGRLAMSLHYGWDDLRGLLWFNYHRPEYGRVSLSPGFTGLVDLHQLADEKSWLRTIRTSRRQDIEKARRSGLTCALSNDIELLLRIYLLTFERQDIVIDRKTLGTLQRIATAALQEQAGFINVCRTPSGDAVSANLIIHDRRCAYYLVGANDPVGRASGAGSLLMLDCLQRCLAMGLDTFDLVGINSPGRGDFKTSFNATPRLYFEAGWRRPG
jgi:hypothetical protein